MANSIQDFISDFFSDLIFFRNKTTCTHGVSIQVLQEDFAVFAFSGSRFCAGQFGAGQTDRWGNLVRERFGVGAIWMQIALPCVQLSTKLCFGPTLNVLY